MSTKAHLELARWACEKAQGAGAREARASVFRTQDSSLEYRQRQVETLSESTEKALNLTLYLDGKYSTHRTSDLRKPALESTNPLSTRMAGRMVRSASPCYPPNHR